MTLYDIVAAGSVLYLDRESGILASYSGGNINVYEYEGMEQGREFDKAGLVPTYNLIETYPWYGTEDLTRLKDYAKVCAGDHT